MKQIEQIKLAFLWFLIAVGFIFHSLLALDGIFFGADIRLPGTDGSEPAMFTLAHIFLEIMSLIMVLLTLFIDNKGFAWFNRIWASLICLMNVFHLVATFGEEPFSLAQIILLSFILTANIVLVVCLWRMQGNDEYK